MSRHPTTSAIVASDGDNRGREEAYRLFPKKELQHLDPEATARCQALLGHGSTVGIWETPAWMHGGRSEFRYESRARIDLRMRLSAYLPENLQPSSALDALLDESALLLTRYALLLRLGPANLMDGKSPLDCTSVITLLVHYLSIIYSRCILRCLEGGRFAQGGLLRWLTPDDVAEFNRNKRTSVEIRRLWKLGDQGLWHDIPPKPDVTRTTNPKGKPTELELEQRSTEFLPIPNDYLAVMGPRVLWLVHDLGPNLIHLFEAIPGLFEGANYSMAMQCRLAQYIESNTWRDRDGQAITAPPFPLQAAGQRRSAKGSDPHEWPPRTWTQVKGLAGTLQSAHLWIALVSMAGRISEIETLERDCVHWQRDGKPYVDGKTYKLSRTLAGTDRDWPAPETLVHALGQQIRLVDAWERIARIDNGAARSAEDALVVIGNHLWASLGASACADPEAHLSDFNQALRILARRIGLSDCAGGERLHAHRFRKTLARLAGIAIVDSPRVLQQLLGHKDIEMTLHYICTDKALAADIERVAREIRIMRSQDVFDAVRASMHSPGEAQKYVGGGVRGLEEMIREHEAVLHREGKHWSAESSYELAVLLTANGHYVRTTKPGVICMKPSQIAAECTCDITCENRLEQRIDDEVLRRDVLSVLPVLLHEGQRALEENNLLVAEDKLRQINEDLTWLGDSATDFANHPKLEKLREALA